MIMNKMMAIITVIVGVLRSPFLYVLIPKLKTRKMRIRKMTYFMKINLKLYLSQVIRILVNIQWMSYINEHDDIKNSFARTLCRTS